MANRVLDTDVELICTINPNLAVTPFINQANAITNWVVSKDTLSELNTDLQFQIELNLAAHFYSIRDQMLQSKNTGRAGGTFQGQTAMVLMGTQYGQTACIMDVTGALEQRSKEAEEGAKRVASVGWAGVPQDSDRPDGGPLSFD